MPRGEILVDGTPRDECYGGGAYGKVTSGADTDSTTNSCLIELNANNVVTLRITDEATDSTTHLTVANRVGLSIHSMGGGDSTDQNTTTTDYIDIDSAYTSITDIDFIVEVDSYDPRGSTDVSTGTDKPDLVLEVYDGSSFIDLGNFTLPNTYTGSGRVLV